MIHLFPRLPRSIAITLAREHATASIEALRKHSTLSHSALSYAPTGGTRVEGDELQRIVDGLREIAGQCGYPSPRSRGADDHFDAKAGRFLHEESGLSLTEACRDEVWNFIGCLLAPDVVRWRFPGERTHTDQFLGRDRGIDNALGRCWWAAELLEDEQASGDPYHLLFSLGVDETVGFSRRVHAVVNRRVAVALAQAALWMEARGLPFPRLDLSRDLMKRFLRMSTVVSFESLGSDELVTATRIMALESARALCAMRGLELVEPNLDVVKDEHLTVQRDDLSELISGIALSSRNVSRFDELKEWLESELALPKSSVGIKYLAEAKNYRNRIGEALRQRPRVLLLLFAEGEESDVLRAVEDRMGLSERTTVALCSRPSDAGWEVLSIASIKDAPDVAKVHGRFPRARIHEILLDRATDKGDTSKLQKLLEEGFADLYRESDDLMDVAVARLLQSSLEIPSTAIRGKYVPDAKNLGNRISEALGTGCQAVVVSVPDAINDAAVRILQEQLDELDHFVVGAVLSKSGGDWTRPARLVLPRGVDAAEEVPPDEVIEATSEPTNEGGHADDFVPASQSSRLVANDPRFASRYHRLLIRLENVTQEPQTFQAISALKPAWFLAQPGVGRKYVEELESLQREIAITPLLVPAADDGSLKLPDHPVHFNFRQLSHEEKRALAKLEQALGHEPTVTDVLDFSAAEYASRKGLGRKTLKALERVQDKVTEALANASEDAFSPRRHGILVSERPDLLELELASEILLEDLRAFLDAAPEREARIFRARTGFGEPRRTMASIGVELGISRERVRQLEKSFRDEFQRSTRVHPKALGALVTDATMHEISKEMASMARHFDGNAEFLDFIEDFCSLVPGSLSGSSKYVPPANVSEVNRIFAHYPSPMPRRMFIDLLESELGVPAADAPSFISWLVGEGRLAVSEDAILPRALTKVQAAAHVLLGFRDGLSFQQVARKINERGLTRTEVDESRLGSYLFDSPWVYVCGQGKYRHLDFLPLDESVGERILPRIRAMLDDWGVESANLQRIHGELGLDVDYFDLRYLVGSEGERFGLFFTGASRVDTVALHPEAEKVTILETIYRMIEGADDAMSFESIAGAVRSAIVARFAIHRLMQEGRIVTFDGGYRSSGALLGGVDSARLTLLIEEILREPGPPVVDADVVRERANVALGLKRGRDFYVSAVRVLAPRGGWKVRRTLFSRSEIPWASLSDAVRECMTAAEDNDAAIEIVRSRVRLTEAVVHTSVRNALSNLRWQMGDGQ